MSAVEGFADLFEGRKDAFGEDDGGCLRPSPGSAWASDTLDLYKCHLDGVYPIGVYPMVNFNVARRVMEGDYVVESRVKWGCVDFDRKSDGHKSFDYETEAECHTAAVNLQNALSAFGVTSWVERTRSRGRHVWLFASAWVSASVMRRALLVACSVVGVSTREVNPKSESLDEGQIGNYVRLPYPGHLSGNGEYGVVRTIIGPRDSSPYGLGTFLDAALRNRTSPSVLEGIAKLYVAPQKPTRVDTRWVELLGNGALVERMLPYTRARFEEDMPDDRSAALASIAGSLSKQKVEPFTPAEILAVLYMADDRWGKYVDRRDRHDRLSEIVQRAVSR